MALVLASMGSDSVSQFRKFASKIAWACDHTLIIMGLIQFDYFKNRFPVANQCL